MREIMTERSLKRWLPIELEQYNHGKAAYRAAGDSKLYAKVDPLAKTLEVKGIVFNTVDICLEVFVNDIKTDWRNTTP